MKTRRLVFCLGLIFLAIGMISCNLVKVLTPKSSIQTKQDEIQMITAIAQTAVVAIVDNSKLPTDNSPVEPPSKVILTPTAAHRSQWGRFWCFDCISDELLQGFNVMNGVPPLSFVSSVISFTVDHDGKISEGAAHFSIATNVGSNSENCATGDYLFDSIDATGSYDVVNNLLTMEYKGTQSYSPMGNTVHCGNRVSGGDLTLTYTFMQVARDKYVMCLPGESGDTCLNHPMATLTY